MPTLTLSKKALEGFIRKKLTLEQLKDRISMLGTDLESIKDDEINVEIFPNRPDLLSLPGFARALNSFIGAKTGLKEYDVKKSGEKVIVDKSVKEVRPCTACAIVKNLEFDEDKIKEVIQIQEKLHLTYGRNRKKAAIGIYPLEKITFPIHYKALEPSKIKFQPLEAEREMTAAQILSQHQTGREYGYLLEGLHLFPVFIDSAGEVLSLPPIVNSHLIGKITEQTREVFIECSGFDYKVLSKCLNMIVTSLADFGGKIYSLEIDYDTEKLISPDLTPEKMKLDLKYINRLLGLNLTSEQAQELLEHMGYGYENSIVLIPAYRADILHQVDLAEDIAIAYGYENFQEAIPNVATIGEEDGLEKLVKKVREILIGLELLEVKNYHLLSKEELTGNMNLKTEPVSLKNALGEHNQLRNSLLPGLLRNLRDNQHNEYPQNIFEIGRVFDFDPKTETGVEEREHLAIVLCQEKTDFTEIKQVLDAFMGCLGLEVTIKESKHPSFLHGRVGEIIVQEMIKDTVQEKRIGIIGEISPQVLINWNLSVPVTGLELNLEEVFKLVR